MRVLLILLMAFTALSANAQVVEYAVVCENNQLTIVAGSELGNYPASAVLKDKLPSKNAARGWISSNYSGKTCDSEKTAEPATPPPPPVPSQNQELPPPPPEKKITHMYPNTVAIFANYLFSNIEKLPYFLVTDTRAFQAGFSFKKGNKALFGFEASFQSWGKVFDTDDAKNKFYADASASFVFSYPLTFDKNGIFWIVPEAGIGVDFPNVLQTVPPLMQENKVAVPSFFLRLGFEAYHVKPFFYYGRTMTSIYKNADFKGNNIGLGMAVSF